MTKKRINSVNNLYHPYDLLETSSFSAYKAERVHSVCLTEAGSSGSLKPGAALRILE